MAKKETKRIGLIEKIVLFFVVAAIFMIVAEVYTNVGNELKARENNSNFTYGSTSYLP